jgi:WD40 repeat protein
MGRANSEAKRADNKAKEALDQKVRAEKQLDVSEGLIYAQKLALAQQAFQDGNVSLALRYLDESQRDRRGWEHDHLWTRFNSRQTLRGHTKEVSSVSWSPDGRRILTGSADETTKVWDADKGTEVLTLKGHTDRVRSVSWSPDGRRILTGSADKTAKVLQRPQ